MTREEAIKELEEDKALYMPEEWIESLDRDTPDGRLITALDMAIKALEQEPKAGHWIPKSEGDGFKNWNCSKCGMIVRNSQRPWYKHCPNCGAKMAESEVRHELH